MAEAFPTLDSLFTRLGEMNRLHASLRSPYLVSIWLPFSPRATGKHSANPPEREPYVGRPKPYWATFAEYERDVRALDERLRAEGRQAIIRAWLPMAA